MSSGIQISGLLVNAFSFNFRGLEGIVRGLFFRCTRNKLNVDLGRTANVSDCILCQLDACFAVLLDDVASNVRLTLLSLADNPIVSTCLDVIAPYYWRAHLTFVTSNNLNSVFVTLLNDVVYYA